MYRMCDETIWYKFYDENMHNLPFIVVHALFDTFKYVLVVLQTLIENLLIFFNVSFFKVWQRRVVSGSYFLMHEFYVREDALSIHNQCDIASNFSNCISKTMYNV